MILNFRGIGDKGYHPERTNQLVKPLQIKPIQGDKQQLKKKSWFTILYKNKTIET